MFRFDSTSDDRSHPDDSVDFAQALGMTLSNSMFQHINSQLVPPFTWHLLSGVLLRIIDD